MKKLILILLILPLSCLGGGLLKSKSTVKDEKIAKLEEQVNGLIKLTTESGHIVDDVPRGRIPVGPDGKPYWKVSHTEPNEQLEAAGGLANWIPGIGTLISGGIAAVGLTTAKMQNKKKQLALDAQQKGEKEVGVLKELLEISAVGVEAATTDGAVKSAIKTGMTLKQQDQFDVYTGKARAVIASARKAAETVAEVAANA